MKNTNLEERLIVFSVMIIELTEKLPTVFASKHLGRQIIRSGTSSALNYGEAQAAESRADFIHKMKLVLKELKETYICLKILNRKQYLEDPVFDPVLQECHELISIFVSSVKTAEKNRN